MFQESTDHTNAWLAFFGTIITASFAWLATRKPKTPFAVEESDFQIRFALEDLVEIREDVNQIFKGTKTDRFLIIKAENGKQSPKWATAIYEQHKGVPVILATEVYKKVRIDDDYREMIDDAENNGVHIMHTEAMHKSSRLRAIYESENVSHSNCYFICRYPLKTDPDKWVVLFCTLATEDALPFTPHEETALELFADRLRGMFTTEIGRGKKQ